MSINVVQREQAEADLRRLAAELRTAIGESHFTGAQLILSCRQIVDLWIESGGSSLDDPVIGFTGIESQTSHVLGGPGVRAGRDGDGKRFEPDSAAERAEIEEIGRFFDESFKRNVEDLAVFLGGS